MDQLASAPSTALRMIFYDGQTDAARDAMSVALAVEMGQRRHQLDDLCDERFSLTCHVYTGGLHSACEWAMSPATVVPPVFMIVLPTDAHGRPRALSPPSRVPEDDGRLAALSERTQYAVARISRGDALGLSVGSALLVCDVDAGTSGRDQHDDIAHHQRAHALVCHVPAYESGGAARTARHAYHALYACIALVLSSIESTCATVGGQGDVRHVCIMCPCNVSAMDAHTLREAAALARQMVDAVVTAFTYGRDYDVGIHGADAGHIQVLSRLRIRPGT